MTEDLPRTIETSATRSLVAFLVTTEDTNGEYVRIRNETSAGAPGVVMRYQLAYMEAVEVLEGSFSSGGCSQKWGDAPAPDKVHLSA
jgi:hypothetical protein